MTFTHLIAAGSQTSIESTLAQFLMTLALSAYTYLIFKLKAEVLKPLKATIQTKDAIQRKRIISRYKLIGKLVCLVAILPPTLAFVLTMRNTYVPAVFTMALLAIIVAVDHDTELEETPEEIASEVKELVADNLEQLQQNFKESLEVHTVALTSKVETIMQLLDTHTWAGVVNKLETPTRVRCVVKHWEVPERLLIGNAGNSKVFFGNQQELDIDLISKNGEDDPIYQAFFQTLHNNWNPNKRDVKSYLRFISPAPLRVRRLPEKSDTIKPEQQLINGLDTRYFFGLLYTMCCLYKAQIDFCEGIPKEERALAKQLRAARIRVGTCSNWVHVIGDEVHQMVETQVASRALSRPLHEEVARFGTTDERRSQDRREWVDGYAEVVQNSYDRGSRAERYIASVLLSVEGEPLSGAHDSDEDKLLGFLDEKGKPTTDRFVFPSKGSTATATADGYLAWAKVTARLLGSEDKEFKRQILIDLLNSRELDTVREASNSDAFMSGSKLTETMSGMILHYLVLRAQFLEKNETFNDFVNLRRFLIEESVL